MDTDTEVGGSGERGNSSSPGNATDNTSPPSGNKQTSFWIWLQVVGMGVLGVAGIQTILANSGNFFAAVCAPVEAGGMGFAVNEFALWLTCTTYCMAFSQLYVGRLWLKLKTPLLLTGSFLVCMIAFALMGTYSELWQWYFSGIVIGLSGGFFFMVGAPIIVTNWFAKRSAFALGVVTIIGALGAAILSLVQATIIAAFGWRMAYLLVAAISVVIALPFTLFVVRFKPEDKGLKPYGWETGMETITAGDKRASGTSVKRGLLSIPFAALFVAVGFCALFGGYQNLWPLAAEEWGYGVQFGSLMISTTALFGLIAPLLGTLIDRLGAYPSVFIILGAQLLSGLGILFFHANQAVLLIAIFFFADQMTVVGTLVPLVIRKMFGARNYTKILGYAQLGVGLIGGLSAPIVSTLMVTFNTFNATLVFAAFLSVGSALFFLIAFVTRRTLKWEGRSEEQNEMA
ncbi:MAG: MFS transporter [Coriobacteriales bacterium]|jgi:MFS family permease|nr:MFS transporter [Coriobacteriales bacterium]